MIAVQNFKTANKSLDGSFALLIFLQIFAIILCFGGPLSILAPVPIILSLLIFGRMPSLFFAALFSSVIWYVSARNAFVSGLFLSGLHLISIFSAVLISEMILRNINPVKGLIISGFIFVAVMGSILLSYEKLGTLSIRNQVSQSVDEVIKQIKETNKEMIDLGNEEGRNIRSVISSKAEIVDEVLKFMPSIIFVGAFFALWISYYSTLRLSKIWRFKKLYTFSTRDLITFKTPDLFVYPLIISLVLFLGADYGFGKNAEIIGGNLLYCLGVFYLFQGFGVYYDLLTFARIGGIFKSAILALTIVAAFKYLAIIGMFDLWFDFRKYFTKKNDEGDML